MPICSSMGRKDAQREAAITLFISAVQAAPKTIPENITGEKYVEYLIDGAKKLLEYVEPGKTD